MKWIKLYNRPNSLQRAQSYAQAMGYPFTKYFGTGIFNWMNVFYNGTSDYYVDEEEIHSFEKYATIKFTEDLNFYKFIMKNYANQFLEHEKYLRKLDKKDIINLNNNEVVEVFKEYREKIVKCFSFMWLLAICEKPMEEALKSILKNYIKELKLITFAFKYLRKPF